MEQYKNDKLLKLKKKWKAGKSTTRKYRIRNSCMMYHVINSKGHVIWQKRYLFLCMNFATSKIMVHVLHSTRQKTQAHIHVSSVKSLIHLSYSWILENFYEFEAGLLLVTKVWTRGARGSTRAVNFKILNEKVDLVIHGRVNTALQLWWFKK